MGDNIYLGDRDGVRTPMQWTPDRNGGFSSADFAQLYLPASMDPVYGYQRVNVESQVRDPSSFLHWIRRMLEVRKEMPVFGVGGFEVLEVPNPAVFAYLRRAAVEGGTFGHAGGYGHAAGYGQGQGRAGGDLDADGFEDIVLCVNNLSKVAQPCELDLSALAGKVPVEMLGRVRFPAVGRLPYFVTLPPYGFYWFSLIDQAPRS